MNIYDIVLFTLKYTPFWAVPGMLIGMHFSYLFWLKDYRDFAYAWAAIVLFNLTAVVVYLLLGGPNGITKILTQIIK